MGFNGFSHLNAAMFMALLVLVRPVYGQNSTLCSSSMLQSFNHCINYLAAGSGSSPTADCCDSLKSLMSSGRDCLCLIVTGGLAFRVPINRTLAASLPRACKKSGVPIECKALPAAPIPAPGPTAFGAPPPSSRQPDPATPPGNTPGGDGTITPPGNAAGGGGTLTPPSLPGLAPGNDGFPAMTPPGIRPDLSTAQHSLRFPHLILLVLFGAITFTFF